MKHPLNQKALKIFLKHFRKGFYDSKYLAWERDYKWNAHLEWQKKLEKKKFRSLLKAGHFGEVAREAIRIESKTNLLFSFEKMALRDAVKEAAGAEVFAKALFEYLHGRKSLPQRFDGFARAVAALPRKQTRVLTWPVVTVFGMIAKPEEHIFLKPRVTQAAAAVYGFPFEYRSKPGWRTYFSLLEFANTIKKDHPSLRARDYIDLQSFIWVLGSDEY